jgi:hypothetical protein
MAAAAIAEPTVKQTTNSSRTFGSGFATTATTFSALAANTKPAAIAYGKQEEGVEGEASPKTTSVSGNIFSDSAASATAEPSAFTASEENEQQQVSLQQLANIPTGEEDETTVFRSRGQLKVYDSAGKEWRQRGAGQLRLNMRGQPPTDLSARLSKFDKLIVIIIIIYSTNSYAKHRNDGFNSECFAV